MRRLLAGAAAGTVWPVINSAHPLYAHLLRGDLLEKADAELAATEHKPIFLSAEQMAILMPLAEAIVPGSGQAQVGPFIDLLLSVDSKENQREFLASIEAVDAEARSGLGSGFSGTSASQRVQLLTRISKMAPGAGLDKPSLRDHFENLKEWIAGAYYSSEIGMRELGWTGNRIFEKYPECRHAAQT